MSRTITVVVVSGSLRNPSRTHGLLQALVERLQARLSIEVHWIRVADLAGSLAGSLERDTASPALLPHLKAIETADLIIAGSPVYRASYTGCSSTSSTWWTTRRSRACRCCWPPPAGASATPW